MTEQEKAVIDAALSYDDAYWAWWNNSNSITEREAAKKIRDNAQDALFDAILALKNTNR